MRSGAHLNSELLPLPLGPVTSRLVPEGTRRVRSCTRVAPVGVTTLARSKEISLLAASTEPCACVAPSAEPETRCRVRLQWVHVLCEGTLWGGRKPEGMRVGRLPWVLPLSSPRTSRIPASGIQVTVRGNDRVPGSMEVCGRSVQQWPDRQGAPDSR